MTNSNYLALYKKKSKSKVCQGHASATTEYFVVAMENTTNPWYQLFHKHWQKWNFPTESKPDMWFM